MRPGFRGAFEGLVVVDLALQDPTDAGDPKEALEVGTLEEVLTQESLHLAHLLDEISPEQLSQGVSIDGIGLHLGGSDGLELPGIGQRRLPASRRCRRHPGT